MMSFRLLSPFKQFFSMALLATLIVGCSQGAGTEASLASEGNKTIQPDKNPLPAPPIQEREPVCTVDRFQQPTAPVVNKVDVLFVMDHSYSMHRHWQTMAKSVGKLIQALPPSQQDIRFSVVLGSITKFTGTLFSAPGVPKVLDKKKMTEAQIMNALNKTFQHALKYENQDFKGAGEALFYSLFHAVTDYAKANQKQGFFRPDAALAVVFMSDDAEEGFPYPSKQVWGLPPKCNYNHHEEMRKSYYVPQGIDTNSTIAALRRLKGDMPLFTSAFVNMTKADILVDNDMNAKCIYDSPGFGYWDIVKRTNGLLYSLQKNRDQGMELVGKMLKNRIQLIHDFKLSTPAVKVDPATIEAKVDGNTKPHTYSASTNVVRLEDAGGAGSVIAIRHCEPIPQHEWTLTDFSGAASQTGAALTWSTREHATSGKVLYGTSPDSLNDEVADSATTTSHAVEVNGLTPNTTYYFQAVSADEFGTEKRSPVISLHTQPDWLMGQLAFQVSYRSASISWRTSNYPTVGYVRWGTSPDQLNQRSADTAPAIDHMVGITGLTAETTYYAQAISRDDYGLEKHSDVVAFTTKKDWAIVGFAGQVGRTTGAFSWNTPEVVTEGALVYGLSPNSLTQVVPSGTGYAHQVSLTNLLPGTTYYFQAVAKGERHENRSDIIALRTANDWSLAEFNGVSTETTITASFTTKGYPTNGKIFWGTSPDAITNFVKAKDNTEDHEATIAGLQPDTLYYVQAKASDNLGLNKESTVFTIRTKALPEPLPVWSITGFEGSATVSKATLVWKTAQYPTTSKLMWGTSPDSLPNAIVDHVPAKNHSTAVEGLSPDTLYYFQVVASDDKGQEQSSSVIAVRTQAIPLPVWSITGFTGTSTQTTVDASWATTEYATKGKVYWGSTADNLNNNVGDETFAKTHTVRIGGLTPNTIYFLKVVAEDDRGQEKTSNVIAVRTQAVPLPSWDISGFAGTAAVNTANLNWDTSAYATVGKVRWGTSSSNLDQETSWEGAPGKQHAVTVSGLNGSTKYYFQAVSRDDQGQEKVSSVISLTTGTPNATWQITGFDGTTTTNQANLIWQTPGKNTRAVVKVGLSANDLTFRTVDVPSFSASHVVGVTGLSPNTTYFFQVVAYDQDGASVTSNVINKKTKNR